jgi:hypothetical protein
MVVANVEVVSNKSDHSQAPAENLARLKAPPLNDESAAAMVESAELALNDGTLIVSRLETEPQANRGLGGHGQADSLKQTPLACQQAHQPCSIGISEDNNMLLLSLAWKRRPNCPKEWH